MTLRCETCDTFGTFVTSLSEMATKTEKSRVQGSEFKQCYCMSHRSFDRSSEGVS